MLITECACTCYFRCIISDLSDATSGAILLNVQLLLQCKITVCSVAIFNKLLFNVQMLPYFRCIIKGSVSRDFQPPVFFHDSKPSGPLINRLQYFRIRFRFRQDIQIFKKAPRCASHRRVGLRGVHHTAESITCQVSVLIQVLRMLFLCDA